MKKEFKMLSFYLSRFGSCMLSFVLLLVKLPAWSKSNIKYYYPRLRVKIFKEKKAFTEPLSL